LQIAERVVDTALLARDHAELEVGVGLGFVDRDGALKPLDGGAGLPALLVDESKLILRVAVVRIDGGGFEETAIVLASAQAGAEIANLSAEVIPGVEKEEWRGRIAQHHVQRTPQQERGYERDPGKADDAERGPVARAEDRADG